jgi:DNA-nicking Smr family endonuclease
MMYNILTFCLLVIMPSHSISPEDRQLFINAVQEISSVPTVPASETKCHHNPCPPIPTVEPMAPDHTLNFRRAGLQNSKFRKLKQGKISTQCQCDLHGLSATDAARELWLFLNHCLVNNMNCALIIHGKGNGILKALTLQVCQNSPCVLALCSAQNKDGGTGAAYVLLKQQTSQG